MAHWLERADHVASTIAAVATVVAAVFAIRGISEWRRQLRETARYRIADRCRETVIRLRDAIPSARTPMETASLGLEGDKDSGDRIHSEKAAFWTHFADLSAADEALGSLRPKAEIHIGIEATRHIERLRGLVAELRGAGSSHFEKRLAAINGQPDRERLLEATAVMYSIRHLRHDPFAQEASKAIADALAYYDSCARL